MRDRMNHLIRWWRKPALTLLQKNSGHGSNRARAGDTEFIKDSYERLGVPQTLHYPRTTLGQMLDQTAGRFPDAPAVLYEQLSWSYRQLRMHVDRMAGGLGLQGVRKGDRVLITLTD